MVRAQRRFLDVLGIERLLAVGGGSLGGMQALEWTVAYRTRPRVCVDRQHCASQRGVAWNAIARNAIMADQTGRTARTTARAAHPWQASASRAWLAT